MIWCFLIIKIWAYRPTDGAVKEAKVVDEGYIVARSFQEDAGFVHGDAGQVVDASGLREILFLKVLWEELSLKHLTCHTSEMCFNTPPVYWMDPTAAP